MTPFRFELRAGLPIFDQVVYAAIKALVSGEVQSGQPFPSVRRIAADLKIHPNTAHKVIQHLIQEGFLEARSGIGTVVSDLPRARGKERKRVLLHEVEQLVVEAKRVGLELTEVMDAVETQWAQFEEMSEANRTERSRK